MKIRKAKEQRGGSIKAEVDGMEMFIPADPSNRHFRALLEAKVSVAQADPEPAPAPAPVTVEDLLEELKARGVVEPTMTIDNIRQRREGRRR